ncbi:MAG: glycosyltransferase family 2 protein [Streptococcus sp.]|nr:glycosyltransferase family 2 protein [Streptococcus sp.]
MTIKIKSELVTIGVIAYNEEKYLPYLLENILEQTYPKQKIELVFVDSASNDKTLLIFKNFKENHSNDYLNIQILENENKTQPSSWNLVIKNFTTDILLRIDAHAELPQNFVEENLNCLNNGEMVCGGPRTNIIDSDTKWSQTLLHVEESMFGSSIASYRRKSDKDDLKYVKTLFHAAYRKEVFDNVGFFNEKLLRTEDNEFHYRVREKGYKICFNGKINSLYHTRNTLKKMIIQKYSNGFWIGKTAHYCLPCLSVFYFVPLVFLLSFVISIILLIFGYWYFIFLILVPYFGLMFYISSINLLKYKNIFDLLIPFLCLIIHISYGLGTLIGLLSRK